MARGREGNNTPTALMALSLGQGTGAHQQVQALPGERIAGRCARHL